MNFEVEIVGPVFKCEEDENIFFSRLYALQGYVNVVGKGLNLYLKLKTEFAQECLVELEEICNIWNTTFNSLD